MRVQELVGNKSSRIKQFVSPFSCSQQGDICDGPLGSSALIIS